MDAIIYVNEGGEGEFFSKSHFVMGVDENYFWEGGSDYLFLWWLHFFLKMAVEVSGGGGLCVKGVIFF